jgi:PilZ domain
MLFARLAERREHPRTKVAVSGRLMLANRRECVCTIVDVSLGGVAVLAKDRGSLGEPVVLYVDDVGRLQGQIVRLFDGGFAFKTTGNSRAAETLARRF